VDEHQGWSGLCKARQIVCDQLRGGGHKENPLEEQGEEGMVKNNSKVSKA